MGLLFLQKWYILWKSVWLRICLGHIPLKESDSFSNSMADCWIKMSVFPPPFSSICPAALNPHEPTSLLSSVCIQRVSVGVCDLRLCVSLAPLNDALVKPGNRSRAALHNLTCWGQGPFRHVQDGPAPPPTPSNMSKPFVKSILLFTILDFDPLIPFIVTVPH